MNIKKIKKNELKPEAFLRDYFIPQKGVIDENIEDIDYHALTATTITHNDMAFNAKLAQPKEERRLYDAFYGMNDLNQELENMDKEFSTFHEKMDRIMTEMDNKRKRPSVNRETRDPYVEPAKKYVDPEIVDLRKENANLRKKNSLLRSDNHTLEEKIKELNTVVGIAKGKLTEMDKWKAKQKKKENIQSVFQRITKWFSE